MPVPSFVRMSVLCVCAVDMTTATVFACVFLRDSGLCLLPTTLCMFVSIQAEQFWCSTCVSNNTQPRRPGKGLKGGGLGEEGRAFNGRWGRRSGMEGEKGQQWFGCQVKGNKCQDGAPVCWNLVSVHKIESDS